MDFITDRYKVVLASKSPRRQALLKEIKPPFRFDFSAFGDDEDEEPGKAWVY